MLSSSPIRDGLPTLATKLCRIATTRRRLAVHLDPRLPFSLEVVGPQPTSSQSDSPIAKFTEAIEADGSPDRKTVKESW